MKVLRGGVTSPKGFLASIASCGIKKSGRPDLALLFSETPAQCAAVFTTNRIKSGSVIVSAKNVKNGVSRAVIVNSGNANCCVGKREIEDAEEILGLLSGELNLDKKEFLIASTGIIGKRLPIGKIKKKVANLTKDLKKTNGTKFAKAIMTTDTVHKEIAVAVRLGGKEAIIGGAVKGSGMISPDMATMLAFFTTDACIDRNALNEAFKESVSESFNRITVDGDMSTNDTSIIFANGIAGNRIIKKNGPDYAGFLTALKYVSKELARKIIMDGEGATKFVEVLVKGVSALKDAEKVARHVANSNLVKTMIAGGDPNWGRIAASVGSSGVSIDKTKLNIYFGDRLVMRDGSGTRCPKKTLSGIFQKKDIKITIDLKSGKESASIWTCDLTEDYVKINSKYEA